MPSAPLQPIPLNTGHRASSGYGQAPAQAKNYYVPSHTAIAATTQDGAVVQSSNLERVNLTSFPNDPHRERVASTELHANAQPQLEHSFENALGLSQMGSAVSSYNISDFPGIAALLSFRGEPPVAFYNERDAFDASQGRPFPLIPGTERMSEFRRGENPTRTWKADSMQQRSGKLVSWFNSLTNPLGNPDPPFCLSTQDQQAHSAPNHEARRASGPLYQQDQDPKANPHHANAPIRFNNSGALSQTPAQYSGSQATFQDFLEYLHSTDANPKSNSNAVNRGAPQPVDLLRHPPVYFYDSNGALWARGTFQTPPSHLSGGDRMSTMPRLTSGRLNSGVSAPSDTQRSQELDRGNRFTCRTGTSKAEGTPKTSSADLIMRSPSPSSGEDDDLGSRLSKKLGCSVGSTVRSSITGGTFISGSNCPLSPARRRATRMAKLRAHRSASNRDRSLKSKRFSSPHRSSRPGRNESSSSNLNTLKRKREVGSDDDYDDGDDSEIEASESELVPKRKKVKTATISASEVRRGPVRCTPKNLGGWFFTGEYEPRDDSRRKAMKYSLFKEHSDSGRKLEATMFIRCQYPHIDKPDEPCLQLVECEASDPGRYLRHLKTVHQIVREDVSDTKVGTQVEKQATEKGKGVKGKAKVKRGESSMDEKNNVRKKYFCKSLIPVGEPRVEIDQNGDSVYLYDRFTRCTSTLCDDSAFQEHLYHGVHRLQGVEQVTLEDGRVYRIGLEEMYKIGCPGCPKINDRHFGASTDNLKKHAVGQQKYGCKAARMIDYDWDKLPAIMKLV
ncbi:hypothetical protein MD484_g3478, partial [Candolleomyces efflorescens]